MGLDSFNQLDHSQAYAVLMQCCTCEAWVNRVLAKRPFASRQMLLAVAADGWTDLTEADYLQAFEGHPKIGDVNSLRAKYSNTKALASGEQSQVSAASEAVLMALKNANEQYLSQFGFIFIVCATGKSAEQMLVLLQQRLKNDRPTELKNACEEQRKIFNIRLEKLL